MAGGIFVDCEFHGFGGTAIEIDGLGENSFKDCRMIGDVSIARSHGNKFENSQILSTSRPLLPFNIGQNKPCFCGSGKKFKRCHGSVKRMATGIKSKNSSSNFEDTKIVTDGVGVELDGDQSTFKRTSIVAGERIDFSSLAKEWGIPDYVPDGEVEEALNEFKEAKSPAVLERSKLKDRLEKNGFNMAAWSQIALSIVTFGMSQL